MPMLTKEMTRLRGEIDALRNARGALMQGLESATGKLRNTVSAFRGDVRAEHSKMNTKMKKGLNRFMTDLRETVGDIRTAVATDLVGAHQAFFGGASGVKSRSNGHRSAKHRSRS